jgi:hypothetical protein
MKNLKFPRREAGSTLMVVVAVTASIIVLVGVAVDYTTQISRTAQRSRKTALAMEIADGHLETLFTQWRNTYRTTWSTQYAYYTGATDISVCGTNFFYTDKFKPGVVPTGYTGSMPTASPIPYMNPSGTPPVIPLPSPAFFSNNAYTVTQYRIQAVDPMITLDANDNALVEGGTAKKGNTSNYSLLSPASTPPSAYGPNDFQYSFFYLAAVDVKVPAIGPSGEVTAKVRRVFEKKFDQPWTYALFYTDDLEIQPTTAFSITGPIHTNGNLYIGNNYFTAGGAVEYGGDYVNGYSPKDPRYPGSGFTTPNFAKSSASLTISDCPPAQVAPYLPFGWNLKLDTSSTTGSGGNDDSYREIIERPVTGSSTDPLKYVRYYNQSGYQVVIETNGNYTVTSIPAGTTANPSPTPSTVTGTALTKLVGNSGGGASTAVFYQGKALYDAREGGAVKVTDVDIGYLVSSLSSLTGWTGVLYLADKGATTYNADGSVKSAGTAASVTIGSSTYSTTRRAFRLINAKTIPQALGLTIVSENPIYVQGDFNTGGTPPSDSGTYTSPTVSGYTQTGQTTKPPAAIIADAITVLSSGWLDSSSNSGIASRVASANITINAALVSGNVPSSAAAYSGGAENFIRLLEDWNAKSLCYYGSMVQMFQSLQAIGRWNGDGTVYVAPTTNKFYYDDATFSTAVPPGRLVIAAYLQQQRWYQVY